MQDEKKEFKDQHKERNNHAEFFDVVAAYRAAYLAQSAIDAKKEVEAI